MILKILTSVKIAQPYNRSGKNEDKNKFKLGKNLLVMDIYVYWCNECKWMNNEITNTTRQINKKDLLFTRSIGNLSGPSIFVFFPKKNSRKESVPDFWFSLSTVGSWEWKSSWPASYDVDYMAPVPCMALYVWSIRHAIRALLSICRIANSSGK